MCLDFLAPKAIHDTIWKKNATELTGLWEYERDHFPAGARAATFDSNHDNVISRLGSQYGGDKRRIILAEAMNLLAPGTPIIYYGNEVGMTGASGTDLDLRGDMDWAAVAAQTGEPESILSWCRYLLKARNGYPALRGGYATLRTNLGTSKAIAYIRTAGSERVVVVANLTDAVETVVLKDLTAHGVAAGAPVKVILGDSKAEKALKGRVYKVKAIPPYGVRVLYLGKGGFHGRIHPDSPRPNPAP